MSMPPPNRSKSQTKSPPLRPQGPNSLMSDLQLPSSASASTSSSAASTSTSTAPPVQRRASGTSGELKPAGAELARRMSPRDIAAALEDIDGDGDADADADPEPEDAVVPVEPAVLAEAINKLDTLRMSQPHSAATSPSASGASSPNPVGPPTMTPSSHHYPPTPSLPHGVGQAVAAAHAVAGGAATNPNPSVPGTPHFGAQTEMLKALDESTKILRRSSKAPSRAPSVSGIGAVVEKPDYSESKIVVAMVGLPARGKSYLSNKLMRYLRWLEYKVEVFNVGQLRRSKARDEQEAGKGKADHSANFFSHSNDQANKAREQLAVESLESLIEWLKAEGNVGIMDATNSTYDRREKIRKRVEQEPGLQLLFLESLCTDPKVIAANIALKVQSGDPDYKGMSRLEAERDFKNRIAQYEKVYQSIDEPGISFCRILNVGQRVFMNRIEGYLQSRIAFYLMNLHLKPRSIYLSRHGESIYNVEGKIGGDSDLSERGWQYARALPSLIKDNIGDGPLEVWTSTLQRTQQTGSFLPFEKKTWKSLDELDAGVCDGMTYEEIEQKYPEDYESRDEDKFNYRYRGGESYRDVVVRLEPVIMELERQENILIIGHQAILRCLYAYFLALPQDQLPYIKIPLHTLIKITPMAYGCEEKRYPLPIQAVDTHRPKPQRKRKDTLDNGVPSEVEQVLGNNASVARDYFGHHPAAAAAVANSVVAVPSEGGTGLGLAVEPNALKEALEKGQEAGEMTPRAVQPPAV